MAKRFKTDRMQPAGFQHADHRRPISRRDFLAQGLIGGLGIVTAPSLLGLFAGARDARAAAADCGAGLALGSKGIPFMCFDLAGGANIAGSNVLVGKQGGHLDLLDTAGYTKLGISSLPDASGANVDYSLGLPFHSQSSLLAGIKAVASPEALNNVDGCVICARSNDDTQNNPHNPMYGIAKAGANGSILNLVGSSNSLSGGNSVAPTNHIEAKLRPTKIATERDTRGLIDVGKLSTQLGPTGSVEAMKAIEQLSALKTGKIDEADAVKTLINSAYTGAREKIECNSDPNVLDPTADVKIQGIINKALNRATVDATVVTADSDFLKTSSVMKLVINGYAGAGTVQFGGYDYHTGNRTVGDAKDLKAGQAIGAALEYAHQQNKALMIYVFSDGAVSSDGKVDAVNSKLVWTSDNGTCAAVFMLVYNPSGGRPTLSKPDTRQMGYYRANGSVETTAAPFANSVSTLAETVVLNYLALNGKAGDFDKVLPNNGLGTATDWDKYIAFAPMSLTDAQR